MTGDTDAEIKMSKKTTMLGLLMLRMLLLALLTVTESGIGL